MGFFSFKDKADVYKYAERVSVGIRQINDELRGWPATQPTVRGLCHAVSEEMQNMYRVADKLTQKDRSTLSVLHNGHMVLYNDFIRELESFRQILKQQYQINLF